MRRHAELLGQWLGDEARGVIDFRKHVPWYTKGFSVGLAAPRPGDVLVAGRDGRAPGTAGPRPAVARARRRARGRTAAGKRVVLPDGWLDDPYACAALSEDAESATSGG